MLVLYLTQSLSMLLRDHCSPAAVSLKPGWLTVDFALSDLSSFLCAGGCHVLLQIYFSLFPRLLVEDTPVALPAIWFLVGLG